VVFQVSRSKQNIAEELVIARKELDRIQNQLQRVSKEKEALNLEKGELIVQVNSCIMYTLYIFKLKVQYI
jgi:hypothetical protein